MNAACILKSAWRLKLHSQFLKWTLCLKILGGEVFGLFQLLEQTLVQPLRTSPLVVGHFHSSVCLQLKRSQDLLQELSCSNMWNLAVLPYADFNICSLVTGKDYTRQGLSIYDLLKHKTTRTIIHQSNPLQMNNKAEFITWSLQTSTVRNTQLTKLLFEGLVEERSSVVCKVARVLLSTFLESTTNNSMLKKKKKKRLLVIRIGPS